MKQTRNETAVITTAARVMAARLAIRAARPRRLISMLLWAAQILLAVLFVSVARTELLNGNSQTRTDQVDIVLRSQACGDTP